MGVATPTEQQDLRRTVRSFLEHRSPTAEIRRVMARPAGYDRAVWKDMAEQLGLQGLVIPERYGGSGGSWAELGVVLEEMGRALLPAPFLSTAVVAAHVLLMCPDESLRARHLPKIADGGTIATLAIQEDSARWDREGVRLPATRTSDGWSLEGAKMFVLDGCAADLFFVPARTPGGVSLFAVDRHTSKVRCTPMETLDQTRPMARVEFQDGPASLIGEEGHGWDLVEPVLDLAAVGLAAEQVGGARKCLQTAVDHAKTREQFGQPIGAFQAVKHKCADMLLAVESAKSAADHACLLAAAGSNELPLAAALAKAYCSEAYCQVAAEHIQVHGGVGFTWEHPAHLYYRRALSSAMLFGDAVYQRSLLAERLNI